MVLDILQRRFGVVVFIWVMCLIAITLGVKLSASYIGTADYPIAPFVSFLMGVTWYLTFLTVVLGVNNKYWIERLANSKRHTNW